MVLSAKRFSVAFLVLFLVLFALFSFAAFNLKTYYMHREYPMWLHVKGFKLNGSSEQPPLVVIGDSRAKAAFLPTLNDNSPALNLSLGGSTTIEGYYTLKGYLENGKAPARLIISYAPYHLGHHGMFWKRNVRFDYQSWDEYSEILARAEKLDPSLFDTKKNHLEYRLVPSKYFIEMWNGIRQRRWEVNAQVWKEVNEGKGHYFFGRAEGSMKLNIEAQSKGFVRSPLLEYYLLEMVELANSKGIDVYWYTMPFNQKSYDNLAPGYEESFHSYLGEISKATGLIVLRGIYPLEASCFGDASHIYRCHDQVTRDVFELLER